MWWTSCSAMCWPCGGSCKQLGCHLMQKWSALCFSQHPIRSGMISRQLIQTWWAFVHVCCECCLGCVVGCVGFALVVIIVLSNATVKSWAFALLGLSACTACPEVPAFNVLCGAERCMPEGSLGSSRLQGIYKDLQSTLRERFIAHLISFEFIRTTADCRPIRRVPSVWLLDYSWRLPRSGGGVLADFQQ